LDEADNVFVLAEQGEMNTSGEGFPKYFKLSGLPVSRKDELAGRCFARINRGVI
jgi:hypothetical protein